MAIRNPVFSGQFYPSSKGELEKLIRHCFENSFGPGNLPHGKTEGNISGVLVPHAGYVFSGSCAAFSYKKIAESKVPDIFVILGTNHTGREKKPFSISLKDFETPFGIVKTDKPFARTLIGKNSDLVGHNETAHDNEHSIEVQLPFLQFLFSKNEFEIVPVVVSHSSLRDYESFAKLLVNTAKTMKKTICVIASSDMTHYGPLYNYVPFSGTSEQIKKEIYEIDQEAIANIIKLDVFGLFNFLNRTKSTICGFPAITCLMMYCLIIGLKQGNFSAYYTSGDILNDYKNVVGYASIVF